MPKAKHNSLFLSRTFFYFCDKMTDKNFLFYLKGEIWYDICDVGSNRVKRSIQSDVANDIDSTVKMCNFYCAFFLSPTGPRRTCTLWKQLKPTLLKIDWKWPGCNSNGNCGCVRACCRVQPVQKQKSTLKIPQFQFLKFVNIKIAVNFIHNMNALLYKLWFLYSSESLYHWNIALCQLTFLDAGFPMFFLNLFFLSFFFLSFLRQGSYVCGRTCLAVWLRVQSLVFTQTTVYLQYTAVEFNNKNTPSFCETSAIAVRDRGPSLLSSSSREPSAASSSSASLCPPDGSAHCLLFRQEWTCRRCGQQVQLAAPWRAA